MSIFYRQIIIVCTIIKPTTHHRSIHGKKECLGLSYLFAADGSMVTGWFNDGVSAKYYEVDGHMAVGLTTIGENVYYFDVNGNMQTGIVEIDGMPYIFDADGKMLPQELTQQILLQQQLLLEQQ